MIVGIFLLCVSTECNIKSVDYSSMAECRIVGSEDLVRFIREDESVTAVEFSCEVL